MQRYKNFLKKYSLNTILVKNHDQIQGVSFNESQKPCKQQIGKVCDMNTNAAIHWDFLFWSIFGQVPSSYLKMQWLFYRYVFWSSLMHSRIGQSKVIFCHCLMETSEPEGFFWGLNVCYVLESSVPILTNKIHPSEKLEK